MEGWRFSLTIKHVISSYSLVAASMSSFAVVAYDGQVLSQANAGFGRPQLSRTSLDSSGAICNSANLNSCAQREPMRPLSSKEVALIMGANYETGSITQTGSHGSCSANGCHTTASVPPSVITSEPITSSGPPASAPGGGGGGGSGGNAYPTPTQQQHFIKCAEVYGQTSPNSKFTTNFTSDYGWSYYSSATGLPVAHETTTTDNAPTQAPSGAGAGEWRYVGASTYYQEAPFHTDLYMYAYPASQPAVTVRTLVHEWYHQNHNVPGESPAQLKIDENNAGTAGQNAYNAYVADNGAKCAS